MGVGKASGRTPCWGLPPKLPGSTSHPSRAKGGGVVRGVEREDLWVNRFWWNPRPRRGIGPFWGGQAGHHVAAAKVDEVEGGRTASRSRSRCRRKSSKLFRH